MLNSNPPQTNYVSHGIIGFKALELPFNISYRYSSLGVISGLNNHFTIDFDAQKYIQDKRDKIQIDRMNRFSKIDSLKNYRQGIEKKIDYLYLIKDKKINLPQTARPNIPQITKPNNSLIIDSLSSTNIDLPIDSIIYPNVNLPNDSIQGYNLNNKVNTDSIAELIEKYRNTIYRIEERIDDYEKLNNLSIDSLARSPKGKVSGIKDKIGNLFSGIKKFNIGLTTPNYSEFLIARTPVRGINLEYNFKKLYLAVTHGKTVNNLFLTNNVLQNRLNLSRNLYNFFDFNSIENGRRVSALKIGYGKKEETHFYIGGLYGKGQLSYQNSTNIDVEKNIVGEIDIRLKFFKNHIIDVVYGRSATAIVNGNKLEELFLDKKERANAILTRYKFINKQTKLSATFRMVDPFYRSFGLGFIRADNIRYEIKAKQKINKKITGNVFYRRENDNLLNLYQFKNIISSYGAGLSYRPNKRWLFKTDIRPLVLNLESNLPVETDTLSAINRNYIANFIVNYNKRKKNTYISATGVYSYYQLTFDGELNTYQNSNLTLSIQQDEKIIYDLIYNNYLSTDDLTNPLSNIVQSSFTRKLKKIEIQLIGKYSFGDKQLPDYGYGGSLNYRFNKLFSLNIAGEKLILGDFYNSVLNNNLSSFPYFFKVFIRIKF